MASPWPFARALESSPASSLSASTWIHAFAGPRPYRQSFRTSLRAFATGNSPSSSSSSSKQTSKETSPSSSSRSSSDASSGAKAGVGANDSSWEDSSFNISSFNELPHASFGHNQHMIINQEFKEALRQILWQFKAPIRYAFAYGSGVFPQSSGPSPAGSAKIHPNPPAAVTKWQEHGQKSIDFIFGVSYTQHWHSLNLQEHRDHYSALGSLGSGVVSRVQDGFGAGAYFHPYVTLNGMLVKYGVVNLNTLYRDLSEWDTMYMAGRLQKPVKILRDDARIRLANQVNLISALRAALLLLPADFTERELYTKIASISYMGDPRMALRAESPRKVSNIVDHQMANFRQLYLPLIDDLPNVTFNDPAVSRQGWAGDASLDCHVQQDMDPLRRGNMVRRLPRRFRQRLYDSYQRSFGLTATEYRALLEQSGDEEALGKSAGTDFDRRIAQAPDFGERVVRVVKETINRPSLVEAAKGVLTAGVRKSWRYLSEKRAKGRAVKEESKKQEDAKQQTDTPTKTQEGKGSKE